MSHPPGRIELGGRDLLIRFEYDRRLVDAVRLLPERRFDPRMRIWTVPVRHVETVVGALAPFGFEVAPEVRGLARTPAGSLPFVRPEAARPPVAGTSAPPSEPTAPRAWTVSDLNRRVRDALRGAFVDHVWVVGEILDLDKTAGRRHRHFCLVEKAGGEARPVAQVEAVLFESKIEELTHKLLSSQPPLTLRDGLEIRVRARIDFYPASGRFQLVVEDIDPEHTLGRLALDREQILRELRAKGLDARNRSLPLPRPALRIAVLTSPTSDGWHDFRRQLEASGLAFSVVVYPVRVQGQDLRRTMLAGLSHFATRTADLDVLCILRGGGSRSDLSWFDDRALAHAVATFPLKILVGIGHERDRTVLDEIAHSFKTPTAVAAHLAAECADEWLAVADRARRLDAASRSLLARETTRLQRAAATLLGGLERHITVRRHGLELAAQRLCRASLVGRAGRARRALDLAQQRLRHVVSAALAKAGLQIARRRSRLQELLGRTLATQSGRLESRTMRLRLLDPRTVLRRGYALVRHARDGSIATDAAAIEPEGSLLVEFRDGVVEARAKAVRIRRQECVRDDPAGQQNPRDQLLGGES